MSQPTPPPVVSPLTDPTSTQFRWPTEEELEETNAAVTASAEGMEPDEFQSRMPGQLKRYWLEGEGAAKIRWGTPGAFDRCVRNLADEFPQNTKGLCANLYHEATGHWPGEDKD